MAFGGEVDRHSFTLRCIPADTLRQRVLSADTALEPEASFVEGTDVYGNRTVEGSIRHPHSRFEVTCSGEVEVPSEEPRWPVPEEAALRDDGMVYRYHTRMTRPGPAISRLLETLPDCDCDDLSRAVGVMHGVHSRIEYRKGVTTISTTAEEAAAIGAGVCQDLAQVMISVLRCRGVPSRYVVGYTVGEGESHAWVEVLSGGTWYGLDPTADSAVGPRHIKVSHGRDHDDCRINRGIFYGGAEESQEVRVSVAPAERRGKDMMENVVSIKLPVDEEFRIVKNRIAPEGLGDGAKRICIVTGTHGDELEGQLVCFELARFLRANMDHLKGIVDIYPALNPLGIDSITRGIPGFDLDMNRTFPGKRDGSMPEYVTSRIFEDISGADVCIDIHASNIFLREIPQVRINEISAKELVPLARHLNVDFIWVHSSATVLESTLAYSLNAVGTKTLVAEMGVGMRLTIEYGNQLSKGIIALMAHLGMWDGPVPEVREPIVSVDGKVEFINAAKAGIFVPRIEHWIGVREGDHLGDIVSPLTGDILVNVTAPCDGLVFTLREYPVVDEGSLIARILKERYHGELHRL